MLSHKNFTFRLCSRCNVRSSGSLFARHFFALSQCARINMTSLFVCLFLSRICLMQMESKIQLCSLKHRLITSVCLGAFCVPTPMCENHGTNQNHVSRRLLFGIAHGRIVVAFPYTHWSWQLCRCIPIFTSFRLPTERRFSQKRKGTIHPIFGGSFCHASCGEQRFAIIIFRLQVLGLLDALLAACNLPPVCYLLLILSNQMDSFLFQS
ncbi:hypothetical protein BJV82DRAFT_595824 [Fennellomyces sp. T-0311]|nr:hypothetical protein BJV82DRAFT_595824 [Fennellomyces sp. T-0311]